MSKGGIMRNGDKPSSHHHVVISDDVNGNVKDEDGDIFYDAEPPDEEKSILLQKMSLGSDRGADRSPAINGSAVSVNTDSTMVVGASKENLDKTCLGKTKRFFNVLYKMIKSVVGLIIILILFSFLGAFIFQRIESKTEYDEILNVTYERSVLIGQIQNLSRRVADGSIPDDQWRVSLQMLLSNYETTIKDAKMVPDITTARETWDFWSSLFFVGTVYTTIGYGHIAPKTDIGKVVCMFYAAVGIPLALLVLAELGKRFTVALKFLWAFVRRYYYTGTCRKIRKPFKKKYDMSDEPNEHHEQHSHHEHHAHHERHGSETKSMDGRSRSGSRIIYGYEVDEDFNLPITMAIGIVIVYIVLGGMMYSLWEEWGFIDSIYFVFISISTIGFGDILPQHPKFFMMSFIYLFVGLSLVSMCINVAIEFFNKTVEEAKVKMMEAKHKLEEARDMMDAKVKQAGKNVKERAAGIKTNIMDETQKIKKKTDEKFRGKRSRSGTPVSQAGTPEDEQSRSLSVSQKIGSDTE